MWQPGQPLHFRGHIESGGFFVAHNAQFELAIWNNIMVPRYGWPEPAVAQWRCTMVLAYAMALPGAPKTSPTPSAAMSATLGVRPDGTRDILGLWIENTEGAKFWMKVFNDLKTRGVNDILIAVTDGLLKTLSRAEVSAVVDTVHRLRAARTDVDLYRVLDELGAALNQIFAESMVAKKMAGPVVRRTAEIIPLSAYRHLRRLIAVELKLESFQPAHVGQMELYLRWLDKLPKTMNEVAGKLALHTGEDVQTVSSQLKAALTTLARMASDLNAASSSHVAYGLTS